eukprot:TRINITY_DN5235_c0_g1_i1.p1 TRINITY_DN5235_c0_g1~~TRINITY_DN5235_c0_g1_i1.p1  ORF type:complete len:222 (-),score=64.01 TRINITY_DN5235_c0_g1_i1:55-720(-)
MGNNQPIALKLIDSIVDNDFNQVQYFIQNGADVNIQLDTKICQLLISRHASVNTDYIPLYVAAKCGHLEICSFLIEKGANINRGYDFLPGSAFHIAVSKGYYNICELLIKNGAYINQGIDTPLYLAAQNGHIEICKLLIEKGANLNQKLPFNIAAQKLNIKICKLFIEKGANLNESFPTYYGTKIEIYKLMLVNGADSTKGNINVMKVAKINALIPNFKFK